MTAALSTTADIAVNLARELVPGANSIDVVNYLNGTPTTASTQSIFDLLRSPAYRLLDDQLVERDPTQVYSVVSPADTEVIPAAPWGGTSLPAGTSTTRRSATSRLRRAGWPEASSRPSWRSASPCSSSPRARTRQR
jgi:hypothetical protein